MKILSFPMGRILAALAALLLVTTIAQAAPNLVISPSRTSGTGPLYVFFDATGTTNLAGGSNALANADFSWNFDTTNVDPNGTWEVTKGMVAGHVFEAPGTYTVSCTVKAADGTTDTDTLSITVSAFSGTTYYVAANGSDANAGTQASPWLTSTHALSQLGANERILFRRGDTFPGDAAALSNLTGGPMVVGAYGSGAAPVLNTRLSALNCDDIRFMDLHLVRNGGNGGVESQNGSTHILALRIEIEGAAQRATYQDTADTFGVFDCYIHDVFIIGLFTRDSTRLSWVGNTLDGLDGSAGAEHGMRVQRGEKQFIAHSAYKRLKHTQTSITIRGDGQRYVMIYDNVMDRVVAVNPTQGTYIQAISQVVVEGNYIGQNIEYDDPSDGKPNSNSGMNITANRVVVRNNVIDSYRRGVNITHDIPENISDYIDVYNNTFNWRPYSDESTDVGGIIAVVHNSNYINVRNNLISAPTLAEAVIIAESNNTNLTVSNNLATATPGYVVNPLPDPAAHNNSPFNYLLLSTSPARNAGANDVPVFYDLEGLPRPSGTNKDLGAFEFDEGDSLPTITTTTLPGGTQGSAYSQTLAVSGGDAPLTWSLAAGSLPAGLSLSSGGVISGTPTGSGTSNFTVQVSDADSDTDTQALSIVITPSVQQYTYLQLEITGTAGSSEGRIAEIDWRVGAAEHPNPHYTGASGNITHTGASGWQAYDGVASSTSYWKLSSSTTGTITLQLASAIAPTSIRIRPVNENRAPSGFIVRGSNNGTTWTVLKTVTGLTTSTWLTAGNDLIFTIP